MSQFAASYISAPHEGLDLTVAPHRLPPSRDFAHLNFLMHDTDRCQVRGPIIHQATTGSRFKADGSTAIGAHFLAHPHPIENKVLLLPIEFRGSACWWPWRVFDPPAPSNPNDVLAGFTSVLDPNAWTHTKITGTLVGGPGPQAAQYRSAIYTMSVIREPGSAQRIAYQSKEHPITYMIKYGSANPVDQGTKAPTVSDVPRAASAIATYQGRLWVGGGIAPSATADTVTSNVLTNRTLTPNALYFTNVDADPFVLASWQTLAVTNTIVVGSESAADYILGLAPTGRYMLILKRNSVWLLTGSGPDTFALKQVSSEGCVDPRSVRVIDDAVFYLGPRGLMTYDGTELQVLSDRVSPLLIPALNTHGKPLSDRASICTILPGPDNYLLVAVGTQPVDSVSSTTGTLAFMGLYHIPTGRWGLLSAPAWTPAGPLHAVRAAGLYVGLNGELAMNLTNLSQPLNVAASQRARDAGPSGDSIFPLEIRTSPIRLASPPKRSKLARSGAEFYHQTASGASTTGRLRLQLRHYIYASGDDADANLAAQRTLSTREVSVLDERPQIQWFQTLPETSDLYVLIDRETAAGTLQSTHRMEFLGAMVEQAPGHQRS